MKKQDKRRERISAFVESLKSDYEFKMGLKIILKDFRKNKVKQEVRIKFYGIRRRNKMNSKEFAIKLIVSNQKLEPYSH